MTPAGTRVTWFVLGVCVGVLLAVVGMAGIAAGAEPPQLPRATETAVEPVAANRNWIAVSEPSVGVVASPAASLGTALVGGFATWYQDPRHPLDAHYAAAGPLLRQALGPDWRGKAITVTSGDASTVAILSDWCACGLRHGVPTIVDLSPAAFADLAPLSQGIVRVEIELVALPQTASEEEPR